MTLLRPELYRSSSLDPWLQDFFTSDPFRGLWTEESPFRSRARRSPELGADFYEGSDAFYAVLELPGVKKEDVDLQLEYSVLRVSGKHTDKQGDGESTFEFSRSLAIPDGVDPTNVNAELKDGLLTITLPKREETKARMIEIK